ncbi:hypothetical protein RRG08_011419 [Elysia crispata]|uniref:Uncharacterized protein n=1 Tax=Elysia crispata TaxID=231223 RepID=A0AAE1AGJ0_9GAST|nr:hypothetical protein RRG08_011419 [Elysia crispata]
MHNTQPSFNLHTSRDERSANEAYKNNLAAKARLIRGKCGRERWVVEVVVVVMALSKRANCLRLARVRIPLISTNPIRSRVKGALTMREGCPTLPRPHSPLRIVYFVSFSHLGGLSFHVV